MGMDIEARTSWIEVDLSAIQSNYQHLQSISQRPVMGIVKANGYGHGLVETARALRSVGAEWLGVARIEEALALRAANDTGRLLVLGFTHPQWIEQAAAENISLTVFSADTADQYATRLSNTGMQANLHLKVDSGMGRLGVFAEDAVELLHAFQQHTSLTVEGMYTHFARADEPQAGTTEQQLFRFDQAVQAACAANLRPRLIHASNSAAAIYFPQAGYDLVRCGIALYGLDPSPQAPVPSNFRPALAWKTRLTYVRDVPANWGISYGHRYTTRSQERIGALAIGYADGFRRRLDNVVLIHGKRVPVTGTICMDQCMVNLDSLPDAKAGDEVVLIGQQGTERLRAEDLAAAWGTINYEVVCGLSARLPRIYHL